MPSIELCLCADTVVGPEIRGSSSEEGERNNVPWVAANRYATGLITERNQEISHAIHGATTWNDEVETLISALEDESLFPSTVSAHGEQTPLSTAEKTLERYILAIIWEIHYAGMSETILGPWNDINCGTLQDFVTLLSFAATYEVNSGKVG
jgi:hypothetical protein